MEVYIKLVH